MYKDLTFLVVMICVRKRWFDFWLSVLCIFWNIDEFNVSLFLGSWYKLFIDFFWLIQDLEIKYLIDDWRLLLYYLLKKSKRKKGCFSTECCCLIFQLALFFPLPASFYSFHLSMNCDPTFGALFIFIFLVIKRNQLNTASLKECYFIEVFKGGFTVHFCFSICVWHSEFHHSQFEHKGKKMFCDIL